jgi:hypothetical protein
MKVKKHYKLGDTVWIYGVDCRSDSIRAGKIVKTFHIDQLEYSSLEHYVVEVPTDIEPILEIRTWKTISQDENGPVGSIREALTDPESARKFLSKIGVTLADGSQNPVYYSEDEPSPDQIHAALEKSQASASHQPLILKDVKSKIRRRIPRKKSKE